MILHALLIFVEKEAQTSGKKYWEMIFSDIEVFPENFRDIRMSIKYNNYI